jgi:hypothetical protein
MYYGTSFFICDKGLGFRDLSLNTTTPNPPKLDNVPINVRVIVITRSQVSKQQVLKDKIPIKARRTYNWQKKLKMDSISCLPQLFSIGNIVVPKDVRIK